MNVTKRAAYMFENMSKDALDDMRMDIQMTPAKMKMTEAGKTLIRYLCKEKPWEKYPDEKYFSLVFDTKELNVNDGDFECVMAITFVQKLKIGKFALSYDSQSPLSEIQKRGDKYILSFVSDTCKELFTDELPSLLDLWGAWDEICCRPDDEE